MMALEGRMTDTPISLSLELRARMLAVLVRDARTHADRTAEDGASVLGLSPEAYASLESGEGAFSLPQLELLAYYFDIPLAHFLGDALLAPGQGLRLAPPPPESLPLRDRIVAVQLHQARQARGLAPEAIAAATGLRIDDVLAYEGGDAPIPLPVLDAWARQLDLRLAALSETAGVIGAWQTATRQAHLLDQIPADLRQFVTQPVNAPYLRLAQKLSQLPASELRELAAILLDITY